MAAGQTVVTRFAATVAAHAPRVALRGRRPDGSFEEVTFDRYADRACRVASGLAGLGVGPGDRVVLMLRNRPEFHVADMAVLLLGATPVSVYNSSAPAQLSHLVTHCGARVAVVENRFAATVSAAVAGGAPLDHVVVVTGPGADDPGRWFRAWGDLLDHPPVDLAEARTRTGPDDLATIIYTSGTTGRPKGVMISHANVCFTAESLVARYRRPEPGLRLVSYLPMAHIAERSTSHYLPAFLGYEVTCCPDITRLGEHLVATRPHFVFGVPRVWERIRTGVLTAAAEDPERAALLDMAVEASAPMAEARDRGQAPTPDQEQHAQVLEALVFAGLRERIGLGATILALTGAAP
ncbi:MAG: AMP-binding protein, partial [Acidimicrobiales bacterium]